MHHSPYRLLACSSRDTHRCRPGCPAMQAHTALFTAGAAPHYYKARTRGRLCHKIYWSLLKNSIRRYLGLHSATLPTSGLETKTITRRAAMLRLAQPHHCIQSRDVAIRAEHPLHQIILSELGLTRVIAAELDYTVQSHLPCCLITVQRGTEGSQLLQASSTDLTGTTTVATLYLAQHLRLVPSLQPMASNVIKAINSDPPLTPPALQQSHHQPVFTILPPAAAGQYCTARAAAPTMRQQRHRPCFPASPSASRAITEATHLCSKSRAQRQRAN